jgi:hypothetical protein
MAATKKDMWIRERIKDLMSQLIGTDKEIIYQIAGLCEISHRTASEHYYALKSQQTLTNKGFIENHEHKWSNASCAAGGLTQECLICHETREVKI